jgi:hypothetical protein
MSAPTSTETASQRARRALDTSRDILRAGGEGSLARALDALAAGAADILSMGPDAGIAWALAAGLRTLATATRGDDGAAELVRSRLEFALRRVASGRTGEPRSHRSPAGGDAA